MIYATSTSWHAAPPTADYIAGGVQIALDAWSDGVAQGVITYCLRKTPYPNDDFTAVQTLYAAYADGVP
jgi:hypothetical protein